MIRIYESNDLNRLAELLRENSGREAAGNPLLPEQIVVQNNDMARWLTYYLAQKDGIAANLNFKFPAELFWETMRASDPGISEILPSDQSPMRWSIFRILETAGEDPPLLPLYQYSNYEDPDIREMRNWDLACCISEVFDQYLSFRPEMLLAWENKKLITNQRSEKWQARLWQRLAERWKGENKKHRVDYQQRFFASVKDGSFPADKLPDRISIFGKIDIPPNYFKLITQLGTLTHINFYRQKGAIARSHPLVQSFAQKTREFEENLQTSLAESGVEFECHPFSEETTTPPQNFFEILKADLMGRAVDKSASTDSSFQVHSCHGPRREVEVLYDYLLFMLDRDEELNPSDILIVCPQIETYAIEIEAVFGAPEEDMPGIPFHIANSPAGTDAVRSGFDKLLSLINSRFKMTKVLDFLECEPVKDKLDLSEENLSMLYKWIDENRIHWGIDGQQKVSADLPGTQSFTWQSGLRRMMTGYSMEPVGDSLFRGIYPYGEIEQSDHGLLLGKLSRVMHQLFECHRQVQQSRTPEMWSKILRHWLLRFFGEIPQVTSRITQLLQLLDSLGESAALADFEGNVSYQIVCDYLKGELEKPSTYSRSRQGGVTFSTIVSKRGIPAKVIGMIGMDDGIFPQSKTTPDFDLIAREPHKGDRSPAKDSRQHFLECILAATDSVYFSYSGQSDRSDVEYPPSVILRELIDYISENYSINEDSLTQKHPLQPFSPRYFLNDKSEFYSYSLQNRSVAEKIINGGTEAPVFLRNPLPAPDDSLNRISLGDFISFFQHPARYLLQRRLGIYFSGDDLPDEDREAFKLSALDKSRIERELGNRYLNNESGHSYYAVVRAQDWLPEGWPGRVEYDLQLHHSKAFGSVVKSQLQDDPLPPIDVNYEFDDIRIAGRLDNVYPEEQFFYRFGRMRPKDLIDLWIRHLFLQTVKPDGHSGESRLITRDKGRVKAVTSRLKPSSEFDKILEDLVRIYQTGLRENILFFPDTSHSYAEAAMQKDKNEQNAIGAAQTAWRDSRRHYPQEGDDPYNLYLYNGLNPLDDNGKITKFKNISKSFWAPFFNVLSTSKQDL